MRENLPESKPPLPIPQVPQADFIDATEDLLCRASDHEASLQEVVDSARTVATNMSMLVRGKLIVKPPLENEKINNYTDRAQVIIAVGEKALKSQPKAFRRRNGNGRIHDLS